MISELVEIVMFIAVLALPVVIFFYVELSHRAWMDCFDGKRDKLPWWAMVSSKGCGCSREQAPRWVWVGIGIVAILLARMPTL